MCVRIRQGATFSGFACLPRQTNESELSRAQGGGGTRRSSHANVLLYNAPLPTSHPWQDQNHGMPPLYIRSPIHRPYRSIFDIPYLILVRYVFLYIVYTTILFVFFVFFITPNQKNCSLLDYWYLPFCLLLFIIQMGRSNTAVVHIIL